VWVGGWESCGFRCPLPRLLFLDWAARQLRPDVRAAKHQQRHQVVGVPEAVAHLDRHLDLVVDRLDAAVADAELDGGDDVVPAAAHLLLDCDHRLDPAIGGGVQPVLEQPAGLVGVSGAEDRAQVLLELPGAEQVRAGLRLDLVELLFLPFGEVAGIFEQGILGPLDRVGGRRERLGLGRRLVALGRPAGARPPGLGVPRGLFGDLPFRAPHGVERVVCPADDVEGVHHPAGVRASPPYQVPYPPGPVGRDDLDPAPLLARELVEEQVERGLVAPLMRPDQAAPVVVDDHHEVLVALLVAGLVDADAADAVEPPLAARGLELRVDARAYPADGVPLDARELGDGRGGATDRQTGDPVLEVPGEARLRPRPGHRLDMNAVLGAADAARRVLEVAFGPGQVHRAPTPGHAAPVVGLAGPAAHGAAPPVTRPRPHRQDYGFPVDSHGFDDGVQQPEGES
jgi:hypothetical protein